MKIRAFGLAMTLFGITPLAMAHDGYDQPCKGSVADYVQLHHDYELERKELEEIRKT